MVECPTRPDLQLIAVATFADKPTLIGSQIMLRPLTADDADAMFNDLADDEATRLTGTHQVFTFDQIAAWCETRRSQTDRLDLAVMERDPDGGDDRWAGEIVISDWDENNWSCGLRIALSAQSRGRGLGAEAIKLVLDHVFTAIDDPPVNRVELEVFDFNARAAAVYRKLGFTEEGRRRQALRWDGRFHDAITMSLLRSEWQP